MATPRRALTQAGMNLPLPSFGAGVHATAQWIGLFVVPQTVLLPPFEVGVDVALQAVLVLLQTGAVYVCPEPNRTKDLHVKVFVVRQNLGGGGGAGRNRGTENFKEGPGGQKS